MSALIILGGTALGLAALCTALAPLPMATPEQQKKDPNLMRTAAENDALRNVMNQAYMRNGPGLPVKQQPTQLSDYFPFGKSFFTPRGYNVRYGGYRAPNEPTWLGRPQGSPQQVQQLTVPYGQSAEGIADVKRYVARRMADTRPFLLDYKRAYLKQDGGKSAVPRFQFLNDSRAPSQ